MTTTAKNIIAHLAKNGRTSVWALTHTHAIGESMEVYKLLEKLAYDGVILVVADGREVELA